MAPQRTEPTVFGLALAHEEVAKDLDRHIALCAEHYKNLDHNLSEIKSGFDENIKSFKKDFNSRIENIWSVIKWVGGAGFTIIVSLLGFLLNQQYQSMQSAQHAISDKLEVIMKK